MNWITTNIRFPKDLYMELKVEAARRRLSVAKVVRERVAVPGVARTVDPKKTLQQLDIVARKIAQQNPGRNLTKALIDMRYEQ